MIVRNVLFGLALACATPGGATAGGDELLPTAHFAPPADAAAPAQDVSGTLKLAQARATYFDIHENSFRMGRDELSLDIVPPLTIGLVQDGPRMIPVRRGPLRGTHPHWEWIVQPGQAWTDAEGRDWLSLPVALAERNANCVHNGLLKVELATGATRADFQVVSETCAYFQVDIRATLPAAFERQPIAGADMVRAADRRERAARIAERPVSDLPFADRLAATDQVPEGALTAFGTVIDGIHYVSDCPTRAGPYPYCAEMVLPSYSWAKSLFAGVGAMRLEKLYPNSMRRSIATYVGGCEEDDWGEVTVADALNMATGHYNSRGHEVDEASPPMRRFFLAEDHPGKILLACNAFGKRADPGERFVYRTGDTYIAGTAMTGIFRTERQDAAVDLQADLLQPIWDGLALSPLMAAPRRTYDESAIPFAGWGLYLTRADLARIAAFLQRGGTIDGEALLDEAMLAEAMQRGEPPYGLEAASKDQRYRHGFWAWNAGPYLDCGADLWVPLMSGYGGLSAAFLPGGKLYYHVSDGYTFRWGASALAIHESHPLCGAAQQAVQP